MSLGLIMHKFPYLIREHKNLLIFPHQLSIQLLNFLTLLPKQPIIVFTSLFLELLHFLHLLFFYSQFLLHLLHLLLHFSCFLL